MIAALALIFGIVQLRANERTRRKNNAEALWREYELLCIEHPRFANPKDNEVVLDLDQLLLDGSPSNFTQYEYFVSLLLYACDSIKEAYPRGRPDWDRSVDDELNWHRIFLTSNYFETYLPTVSPTVCKLIYKMRQDTRPE